MKMRIANWCLLASFCLLLVEAVPRQTVFPANRPGPNSITDGGDGDDDGSKEGPPNIIIIIADDMGWNDVSFHGSDQIPTPNIDALAYNGVILNSHYVSAMCTPSRSALLTGKLPIHTGMQHLVILEAEPRGLPLHEKILPQYLKDAGYKTHALGKWHQGFHRREYTPTFRGFDSHFGYWNGLQDYYTHEVASSSKAEGYLGFDMRRNMSVARDTYGKYSTDLFTEEAVRLIEEHRPEGGPMFMYFAHLAPHSGNDQEPLQAPDDEVAKFAYIRDPERRIYAAMMSKLDQSVGEVVTALRRKGMLHNSIIIFMADNGAATQGIHYNRGSNYPLRGIKASAWEGAVRGAAAVWSPLIRRPRRVSEDLMYVADWLPTLVTAAGLQHRVALPRIDGVDMWASISGETYPAGTAPRSEVLVNIDPVFNYSAIRRGDYKYILGTVGNGEEWYGETGRPVDALNEGPSPVYEPERILMSKTGTAIAGLLTSSQMNEVRSVRHNGYERVREDDMMTSQLLTADELLKLRSAATLHCTVPDSQKITCNPLQSACLFNIREDPCEQRNLAKSNPNVLQTLEEALVKYRVTAVPPSNVPNDPQANPAIWAGTWVNWLDENPLEYLDNDNKLTDQTPRLPAVVIAIIAVLLGLAVVGIFALLGLRCTRRFEELKKKKQQYRDNGRYEETEHPSETTAVLEHTLQNENPLSNGKNLTSFAKESRDVPKGTNLGRNNE